MPQPSILLEVGDKPASNGIVEDVLDSLVGVLKGAKHVVEGFFLPDGA